MRSSSGSATVFLFFGGGPDSDSLPSLPDVESSLEGAGGGVFFDFFFVLDGCSLPELLLSLSVRLRFLEDTDLEEVAAADFFVDLVVTRRPFSRSSRLARSRCMRHENKKECLVLPKDLRAEQKQVSGCTN